MGGLGNFLFQIAAGYALALEQKGNFYIDDRYVQPGHNPIRDYKNNILRNIDFFSSSKLDLIYTEQHFHYSPVTVRPCNIMLQGYFQSEKHFTKYSKEIKHLFEIDKNSKDYLYIKYKTILEQPTCSLHVRRGDYLEKQHAHVVQPLEYYKECVGRFAEDMHFLIFSDDITWCKKAFNFLKNKTFIVGNKDYQDLYLMSLCTNNIIANSSFSWWGAWLNNTDNKTVIAPKRWFNPSYIANNDDLYCQNWVIL